MLKMGNAVSNVLFRFWRPWFTQLFLQCEYLSRSIPKFLPSCPLPVLGNLVVKLLEILYCHVEEVKQCDSLFVAIHCYVFVQGPTTPTPRPPSAAPAGAGRSGCGVQDVEGHSRGQKDQ